MNKIKDNHLLKEILELYGLPKEIEDLCLVFENGAEKHGAGSWLYCTNVSMKHKNNHDSMFHHLSESYCGLQEDKESGLDPLLHLATRAIMMYSRKKRGIKEYD